jgi:hypothetical protein
MVHIVFKVCLSSKLSKLQYATVVHPVFSPIVSLPSILSI